MKFRYRLLIRLRPVLRFIKFRILHVDDSPQQIARGIAAGVFTAFLPLLGLHLPLAFFFALLTRANKVMALIFVWISNPLTFVFIYYPCYRLGCIILPMFRQKPQVEMDQIQAMFDQTFSLSYMVVHFFDPDYWRQAGYVFTQIGSEMLVGGIILGTIAANIVYWNAYYVTIGYRTRKQNRKTVRKQNRTQ